MGEIAMNENVVKVREIRLAENGHLEIKRKFGFESMMCPFAPRDSEGELELCGDWCPLFGEAFDGHKLTLCNGRVLVSNPQIIDDRIEATEED